MLRRDVFKDFASHLDEFRGRFIACLITFGVSCLILGFFSHALIDFLTQPLRKFQNAQLFFGTPYDAFFTHLKAVALSALVVSSPVFLSHAWKFVTPGLYPQEKKILFPLIFLSIFLFLAGVFFAYGVVIPAGLTFLLGFETQSLRPLLAIGPYFSFLTGMTLAFGLLFNLPVVVLGLVKLKVVKVEKLAQMRPFVIIAIFVAGAVFTPPDPISQFFLAAPLWLLFEGSLALAKLTERPKGRD